MTVIKVAQIIDSLSPGGAEMMAVNIANELSKTPGFQSFIVVSRKTGILEKRIHSEVKTLFLNKKSTIDFKALFALFQFLKKEKVDIVHAHSSSFYFPAIIKKFSNFKLVWHDHYGKTIDLEKGARSYPVKPFARFFDYVFAVNRQLVETDIRFFNIAASKICYLPNFSVAEKPVNDAEDFILKGKLEDRIVCLANLRPQKDHLNLLNAFRLVLSQRPHTYLYLIGGGNQDDYERGVLAFITSNGLQENVIWLGTQTYPAGTLGKCAVGVLSSESEGLPLAVIEYGLAGLAVVSTAVGEIPSMLSDRKDSLLVLPKNSDALAGALLAVLNREVYTLQLSDNLKLLVNEKYSPEAVLLQVTSHYKKILKPR